MGNPLHFKANFAKQWVINLPHMFKERQKKKRELLNLTSSNGSINTRKSWKCLFNEPCAYPWEPKPLKPKTGSVFDDGRSFGNKLMRKGWVRLGGGAFSTVYHKPGSQRVIKVTRILDDWINYAHWANQNGYGGSWAPQVYSYKLINGKSEQFSLSVMEKLESTLADEWDEPSLQDAGTVCTLVDRYLQTKNVLAGLLIEEVAPGGVRFLNDFSEAFKGRRYDLHAGNYMVRKNGTLVLIDPLGGGEPKVPKRLKAGDFTPSQQVY